mmetsp:Transcript_8385/g.25193  ORF Transcript_8385/g.25193 Transcript_8385/m.25193 type:complete len:249 (+) Transcript_8385:593-1339(+)
MMPTRSQSTSASTIECVVKTTARPAMVARMRFQRLRWDTGSRPAEGSSSRTVAGSPTRAAAQQSLRFMPPERRPAGLAACAASSTRSSVSATAAATRPGASRRRPNSSRCSRQLRDPHSVFCWFTTPRRRAAAGKSTRTDAPPSAASPDVGATARVTMDMVVVLPAPLAPRSPKTSPDRTPKVTFCTASMARWPWRRGGKTLRASFTSRPSRSRGSRAVTGGGSRAASRSWPDSASATARPAPLTDAR